MSGNDALNWLPDSLHHVATRITRADALACEMASVMSDWSWNADLKVIEERRGDDYQCRIGAMRPVPPVLALYFSEIVSHLRVALDNTMWFLVERAEGGVPKKAKGTLYFPIFEAAPAFDSYCDRKVTEGVKCLGNGQPLRARLRSLQPFEDSAVINSVPPYMAGMVQDRNEEASALHLLQRYSNTDKHRSVTVLVAQVAVGGFDSDLGRPTPVVPLEEGVVFAKGRVGDNTGSDLWPWLLVQRPSPFKALAAPIAEASDLIDHVANVVLPTLFTGFAVTGAVPRSVELGDAPETLHERFAAGVSESAQVRSARISRARVLEALERPIQMPTIVEVDEFTKGA